MSPRVHAGQHPGSAAEEHLPPAILSAVEADDVPRTISRHEYRLFQALVEKEAGIHLGPEKLALVVSRLRKRLIALGLRTYGAYYRLVNREDPAERVRMLDCISTNETSFFREARQFDFLKEQVLPRWSAEEQAGRRGRRIRVWSAACSTGEEPYSLGMVLLDRVPAGSGWAISILASDLSTRALDLAALGTFPIEDAKDIPPEYLRRFMLRGTRLQTGRMRVTPALASLVTFRRINLNDRTYPAQGPFELIFCRNVLMYFDPQVRQRVVGGLLDLLAPGGYLFLGHAESLSGVSERARHVGPAVYVYETGAGQRRNVP